VRKIAQFCLVAFFLIALTVNADSTIRPTILHRIPLKWYQHGDLMQITTNEAYAWAGPNNQVVKYPAGIDIRYISGVNRTLEIITDCGWNRILSIETNWDEDPVKNSVHAFGECGLDDGQFRFPVGVQIGGYAGVFDADIDYVYVIDALNRRIVRLQYDMLNGQLVWNSAFGQENLVGPRGIVYIDNNTENRNDDEILVTDMLASKIVRFTAVGNYIGSYGVPGSGMGQILTPYGITKSVNNGESQNIYITDIRNVKICCYEWTPEGVEFQNEICFSDNPQGKLMGITTDDQGIVYVADRIKNRLLKLSPELRLIAEISEATAGPDYAFYKPEAILFNDGALVVINKFCQSAGFECFQ
jgi:sugar lactone lactonase YvrE